jgi:hypothetical protein
MILNPAPAFFDWFAAGLLWFPTFRPKSARRMGHGKVVAIDAFPIGSLPGCCGFPPSRQKKGARMGHGRAAAIDALRIGSLPGG